MSDEIKKCECTRCGWIGDTMSDTCPKCGGELMEPEPDDRINMDHDDRGDN